MLVFTANHVATIKARFENQPEYAKAITLFHVVTHPRYADLRAEIEGLVATLAPDTQKIFVRNLRTTKRIDQFMEHYHELAVYGVLRRIPGASLEYQLPYVVSEDLLTRTY